MPRPLVPGTGVIARAVAGRAQCEGRDRGARARVAVRHDLLRVADPRANVIAWERRTGTGEELLHVHVARARDVALARIARIPPLARVLLRRAHVEQGQPRIFEPARKLLARRDCVEARLERRLDRLQLHLADLGSAGPRGKPAE